MNKKKQSHTALILLIVTIFLTIGSYAVMYVLKLKIRTSVHAMIQKLPDNQLVPFEKAYTPGAENEDEIIFQGHFFDVAKYKIQGKKIVYYCYYDKDDTKLANFSAAWHDLKDIKSKRKQLSFLFKILEIKYIYPQHTLQTFTYQKSVVYPDQNILLYFVFMDVSSPPPKTFSQEILLS